MSSSTDRMVRRHLVLGWSLLFGFLLLGTVLETLHGLKIGWYVDVANSTRRLMWTLAHAHGTLVGLVHVAFAWTVRTVGAPAGLASASACLTAGSILLPAGFLLGGIVIYGGDPGLGVYLTPIGALLLLAATALTIRAILPARARL